MRRKIPPLKETKQFNREEPIAIKKKKKSVPQLTKIPSENRT